MRAALAASTLVFCTLIAGCGDKPSAEAEKMHPNGIGLDIETIPKPAAKPSR